jgi:hypothetical protein
MKAGKRTAQEIKQFLEASYEDKPPKKIDDFILDEELSTETAKVYYNPQTGEAIVAHRGTKGVWDWGNNLAYALGAYEMTPRYKKGKSVQTKAEKKYNKKNIDTLGHSQGAVLARKLGADTNSIINVNPAYAFEKPKKNEYNIRSSSDVVSGLYAPVAKTRQGLFPNYSKKRDITIPTQSATDILGEHSYNILDRLEDSEIGVGAGIKISSNNIMKCGGRRTNKLGFTADDIDWFGGSQGTAYINRGTNPFGTRGAGAMKGGRDRGYEDIDRVEEEDEEEESPEAFGNEEDVITANDMFIINILPEEELPEEEEEPLVYQPEPEGGRRKNPLASIGRTMAHAINPMSYVLGSKKGTQAGIGLGDATNNYILPATVSAGKPIYDATAMTASTMLTGNPMLGKAASDTLWNEMVAKQGYDPRERQKSQELGELSSTLGQAVAKPYSASLGGLLSRNLVAEEFRRRDRQRRIGGGATTSTEAFSQFLDNEIVKQIKQLRDQIEQTQNQNLKEELTEQLDQYLKQLLQEGLELDDDSSESSVSESSEDAEDDEDTEDEMDGKGLRRKGVNFEKVKWGTFTRMFKEFKKENPRSRVKDLVQFANYVIKNKKKFSDKTLKKAHFYKNIIMKGG